MSEVVHIGSDEVASLRRVCGACDLSLDHTSEWMELSVLWRVLNKSSGVVHPRSRTQLRPLVMVLDLS